MFLSDFSLEAPDLALLKAAPAEKPGRLSVGFNPRPV